MLSRIDARELARLARGRLPAPVDVLNLIRVDEARFGSYRWYGLLVAPALLATGASVRWMARHERAIHGAPQADKLLVVRYPSHRRFLAMTLNPYYLAINRLRERGVTGFEASFTHASNSGRGLGRHSELLVAHFNSPPGEDALARVTELLPGEVVYAAREVSPFSFLRLPVPTDPRPLTFREVAFVTAGHVSAGAIRELERVTDGCSLQLYQREPASAYLPCRG